MLNINNDYNEELFEISLSSFTPNKVSKNILRIDKPTIFIVIPDDDVDIYDGLYKTGILLNNCIGIKSPRRMVKIGRKSFNGRTQYKKIYSKFHKSDVKGKKIKIIQTFKMMDKDDTNYFAFYDMTIYRDAYKYYNKNISFLTASKMFLNFLNEKYTELHQLYPTINIETLFLIKNNDSLLSNFIKKIKIIAPTKKLESFDFFSNYLFISNVNKIIIPIMNKEKAKTCLIFRNINKVKRYLKDKEEIKKEIKEILPIKKYKPNLDETKNPNVISNLVKAPVINSIVSKLKTTKMKISKPNALVTNRSSSKTKISVNKNAIQKSLKKYKINDDDVLQNISSKINSEINLKQNISEDHAKKIILKAVNYTIFGTETVDKHFIRNPNQLIKKLDEKKTFETILPKPKIKNNILQPEDVIGIKYTTGVWRQKQEFTDKIIEDIKKLFMSLEKKSKYLIKVKSIKHEIIDDSKNRKYIFTVTLQNLNGGFKNPYEVKLEVPALINDRYFKLNNVTYILGTQQFLNPITKTNKNTIMILSNYAPIQITLENVLFSPTQINKIINYIKIKYPSIIKYIDDEKVTFKDNSTVYLTGTKIYDDSNNSFSEDDETGEIVDKTKNKTGYKSKYEFLFEILTSKIKKVNKNDNLSRTKKSIPYVALYIGGFKLPLIVYLWQLKGLLTSLTELGIDFSLSPEKNDTLYNIQTVDKKYLHIYPKTKKEIYIINGLMVFKHNDIIIKNLDDPEEIYPILTQTLGQRSISNIDNVTKNEIDPITEEILNFNNLPTSLPTLLSTYCVDLLFNYKEDSLADLKIYRTRLSEMILNIMYKQIGAAYNEYASKVDFGNNDAKIHIQSDYVLNNILQKSASLLSFTDPINPVDEIELASKTTKAGPGGVPSAISFKPQHRDIHSSQIGIMSANATPESNVVGLSVSHTLTPSIINKYGSYGAKNPDSLNGWNAVSLSESLIPFQNQIAGDRILLACNHTKQITPTNGNEPPLVRTGAEFIVPQISSSRFVQRAKNDGKVIKLIPHKILTVEYNNGVVEDFDILPRMSRSKMSQFIILEMSSLKVNEKFKKDQVIAHTKNFSDNGVYSAGRNSVIAIMNYDGYNHEDAYVISNNLSSKMSRDLIKEIQIIVPQNTKILKLIKDKIKVFKNDVLVEFTYDDDLEQYLKINQIPNLSDEEEEILYHFVKGDNSIKLFAVEGEIVDIKVFINNKNTIDKKIVNMYNEISKETIGTIKTLAGNIKDKNEKLKATDNMKLGFLKTGGHKIKGNEFKGARIVYYIKKETSLDFGDKIATRFGAKGVISKIISDKDTPKTELFKKIDVFISPIGVFSRRNQAMIKEIYLGKIMYFLNQQIHELANNNAKYNKIYTLITDIYKAIGSDKLNENIKLRLSEIKESQFTKKIKSGEFKLFMIVEPFEDITFEQIKEASKILKIPLDEKVYLPEYDTWTKTPVPVGVTYMQALEQTGQIYANVRSTGKYQELTGQSVRRKSRGGGQAIGNLDINALLSFKAPNLLKELMGLRSDIHSVKQETINNIIINGKSNMPQSKSVGVTINLMKIYLLGIGLYVK